MEEFLIPFSSFLMDKEIISEIEQINDKTLQYGLKLSENDVRAVIAHKSEALKGTGRIEFGEGIITKIISTFCDSPYILQENYVEIINDLIETFYYYKNETMEEISDDELIDFMKEYFDNQCQGDLELLKHKYLEKVAHNIKYGVLDYFNMDQDEDDDEIDEDDEDYGDGNRGEEQ